MSHWLVRFTRPGRTRGAAANFARTSAVVCAIDRAEAKETVDADYGAPVTASRTERPVTWPGLCWCSGEGVPVRKL